MLGNSELCPTDGVTLIAVELECDGQLRPVGILRRSLKLEDSGVVRATLRIDGPARFRISIDCFLDCKFRVLLENRSGIDELQLDGVGSAVKRGCPNPQLGKLDVAIVRSPRSTFNQ